MTREIRSSSYPDNKQNCYMVPYSMEMNRYFPEILRGKDTFFYSLRGRSIANFIQLLRNAVASSVKWLR